MYNDYDYQLSKIVSNFKENIKNKSECESLKRKANYLSDDIKTSINDANLDSNEKIKLGQLLKETKAVEEFIGSIGNAGNSMFIEMAKIQLANGRINASISKLAKYKYCVDIYQISLNGYIATMAFNNSTENYSIYYKWKSFDGQKSGNGNMGLPNNSMRHILDNRENQKYNVINIVNLICKMI